MKMNKYLVLETDGFLNVVYEEDYASCYDMLKENVDGCVECVSFINDFSKRGIDLWVNEAGKLNDLLPTIAVTKNKELVEVLNGNIVFTRVNDNGETIPLTDEDIRFIRKTLNKKIGIVRFVNLITGSELENIVSYVEM